jgi:hypothetical protein
MPEPDISYEAVVDPNHLTDLLRSGRVEDIPRMLSIDLLLTDLVRIETVRADGGAVSQTRLPNTPNHGLLRIKSPRSDIDNLSCSFRTHFAYERGRNSYRPNTEITQPNFNMRGTTALLELVDQSFDGGYKTIDLIGFRIASGTEEPSDERPVHTFNGTAQ